MHMISDLKMSLKTYEKLSIVWQNSDFEQVRKGVASFGQKTHFFQIALRCIDADFVTKYALESS